MLLLLLLACADDCAAEADASCHAEDVARFDLGATTTARRGTLTWADGAQDPVQSEVVATEDTVTVCGSGSTQHCIGDDAYTNVADPLVGTLAATWHLCTEDRALDALLDATLGLGDLGTSLQATLSGDDLTIPGLEGYDAVTVTFDEAFTDAGSAGTITGEGTSAGEPVHLDLGAWHIP